MQEEHMIDKEHDNMDHIRKMYLLKEYDYDKFMRVLYKSLEEFPEKVAKDPYPLDTKVNALNVVRSYFEKEEEYEKCDVIKNILNGIQEEDIPSVS